MRALVSGSTGFSGGHLVRALQARGLEVHCLSHRVERPGVRRADLCSSRDWLSVLTELAPQYVFHLSGVAHSAELTDYALQNAVAAAALLDAVKKAERPPEAILMVGTAAEYGIVPPSALPVSETFQGSPSSPYGVTKYAQTELALGAAGPQLRTVVTRPSNIIGPGMPLTSAIGSFARQLREIELGRRDPILKVGDLSTSRDFVDVRDAADAYVRLMTETNFGGVINISSGEYVTMQSILDRLISEFGVEVRVEMDPSRLRSVEIRDFAASRNLLNRVLAEPALIPLSESIHDIVAHERQTIP